jgi:acyl carrier protein
LAQEIGQILRLPAEKIDHQKSVFELGMDSLMGMELAIAVEEHFAVKLPLMALAEGVNIDQLAVKIVELVKGDEAEVFDSQRDSMQAFATRHEGQLSVQQQQTLTQLLKTMESDGVKHE